MISNSVLRKVDILHICRNEKGMVLPVSLVLLVILVLIGSASVVTTSTDLKISSNYKGSKVAFNAAEAGLEHARKVLRDLNVVSGDKKSFSDELVNVVGVNGVLDGDANGTDDIAIVPLTVIGQASYIVYLINDQADGWANQVDSNMRATLVSIGKGTNNSQQTLELNVDVGALFDPFSAITLLGNGVTFTGNTSGAKELHGDDQCGTDGPKPVITVSDSGDVSDVQDSVDDSKPGTYYTLDEYGNTVTASTDPNLIASSLDSGTLSYVQSTYDIDLLNPADLWGLVQHLTDAADTVKVGNTDAQNVNVGVPGDPQLVVIHGDFDLNTDGTGILVVTGELDFQGNVNYDGVVLVIGKGSMIRKGGGFGSINGGILVANIEGPDTVPGTADDVLGPSHLDTSGGGYTKINYCSTAVEDAFSALPVEPQSFKDLTM